MSQLSGGGSRVSAAHILVVEDEDIAAMVNELILSEMGCRVTVVGDAESALTALKENAGVDLILLDRGLPGMDGLTLLKHIKSDAGLRHLPVILQSGLDDVRSVSEGLAAGAYHYLTKPPKPALLMAVVRAALEQQRESSRVRQSLTETVQALRFLQEGTFRFQTIADARALAQSLARACPDPARAVLGLQELLINAVEHGNYGLSYADKSRLVADDLWHQELDRRAKDPAHSQRQVTVHLSSTPEQFRLTVQHEGAGFDWSDPLDFSPERAFDLHGRGIAMARLSSFDLMEYQGNGNTVMVVINLPSGTAQTPAGFEGRAAIGLL